MTSAAAQLRAVATNTATKPQESLLHGLLEGRSFDPDAWHAMNERDNRLIEDEIAHGSVSRSFVYEFKMKGDKLVSGVSVVGARQLAAEYKGIKSRIVATIEKTGAMFIFRTFTPLSIEVRTIHELEGERDFYECVLEISDIKTGNSLEVRKKETKTETSREGNTYDRPHYDVIAESKAFRNGVLNLLPQNVVQDFKKRCLAAGNSESVETMDSIRDKVLTFAIKHALPVNRAALAQLTFAEISGLGAAARESLTAFKQSAAVLNLVGGETGAATGASTAPPPPASPAAKKGGKGAKDAGTPASDAPPAKKTYAQYVDMVQQASDADSAAVFVDQARTSGDLNEQMLGELGQVFNNKWSTQ